ncbi:ABC transporter permease [Marinicrinis lubricantis]|uniref:ABC transporter permease n=1 Tax=Marinicrinis lubricantis TaxID=2086470 RepID=A0ABW1IVK1_9BACL
MNKLIELEWRKLQRKKVFGELIVYWVILMFLPVFFLKVVLAESPLVEFGNSYTDALSLMLPIQMGFVLFGASLINHVFIEEYKNKTMTLSFGYPISRKTLVMAKVQFIFLAVFLCTMISFVLAGITTYVFDRFIDVIDGKPSMADLMNFTVRTIIHSAVVALASLIPLFPFGIWRRAVIPTVICAVFLIQLHNLLGLLRITLNQDVLYAVLSVLGAASVYLAVKTINQLGDV